MEQVVMALMCTVYVAAPAEVTDDKLVADLAAQRVVQKARDADRDHRSQLAGERASQA